MQRQQTCMCPSCAGSRSASRQASTAILCAQAWGQPDLMVGDDDARSSGNIRVSSVKMRLDGRDWTRTRPTLGIETVPHATRTSSHGLDGIKCLLRRPM